LTAAFGSGINSIDLGLATSNFAQLVAIGVAQLAAAITRTPVPSKKLRPRFGWLTTLPLHPSLLAIAIDVIELAIEAIGSRSCNFSCRPQAAARKKNAPLYRQ